MKRAISLILSIVLLCGMIPAALAANTEANDAAQTLYALGLFRGTGTRSDGTPEFELDRAMARSEGVTMLVRLLGKEAEAASGTRETPFPDVPDWAEPYVGYAYANQLTLGGKDIYGNPVFDSNQPTSATQYITFVLRALGYDSSTDFDWRNAWTLSDELGMTGGRYTEKNSASFTRGDAAIVSLRALRTNMKDSVDTLADRLIADGVFTKEQYESALNPGGAGDADRYAPETVYRKMIAMKEEYPEGRHWTNNDSYVLYYTDPESGYETSYYGYGCVGFAFIVSSAAFGELPLRTLEAGEFTYDQLRVGDMPRINHDTHTVIILEKYDDHVVIAEGNYNSSVHWGRTLTREQVMKADYVWTRYPEG